MNPWDVLGWILVGIVGLICVIILLVVIFFLTSVIAFVRERIREDRKQVAEEKKKVDGIVVPYFEKLDAGAIFQVQNQPWRIEEVLTDYDIDRRVQRLQITARDLVSNA